MGSPPLGADPAPSQLVQAVLSVLCRSRLELKSGLTFRSLTHCKKTVVFLKLFGQLPVRFGSALVRGGSAPAPRCCAAALRLACWDLNGVLRDIPPTGTEPEPAELGSFRKVCI